MAKNSKRKLLFTTLILTLMLISSAYSIIVPDAHASQLTTPQKAETISRDVIGLELAKYAKTARELPSGSYLGVLPQENLRYTLELNGSKVDLRYTFTNGNLQVLYVLEIQGSPLLTKTAVNTLASAKDFLNSYQQYSGKPFYSELSAMLNAVDVGKNSTKTYGNTKLETTTSEKYESFRWTYTYNGIEAPSKCVSLGYENGFLKYFVDNWNLYTIGSTEVKVSEEQAISTAMDQARTFSWNMGTGNSTFKVKDYNVANAMVWETLFCSNLDAATPRSQDPLMLYPIRHVWVSLDKFYPGNVYGFNVYVWADTGEVCYIHERVSTLNPPSDMVASVDDFTVEAVNNTAQLDTAFIPWIMLPLLAFFTLATIPVWFLLGREKNSPRKRFSKLAGLLFCLLLLSFIFLFPVSTVKASSPKIRAEIWGAESTGGYDSRIPGSWKYWRKTYNEIQWQQTLSLWINIHFNASDYDVINNQGDDSLKNLILDDVSYNEANYPRVAVVDFDHGVATETYVDGEWHYMFEDNVGTIMGPWREDGQYVIHNEHAVTDMDIYPRTAQGKVFFAFINTCMSANIHNTVWGSTSIQGIIPGTYRARGMPFAWTHHKVGYGFSSNGYSSPDSGDFCYIGFPRGSAALAQPISNGTYTLAEYAGWVYEFFVAALDEDVSVINAMDLASIECFTVPFYATPLDNGFTANWPTWNITHEWHDNVWPPEGSDRLVVYGNGNIHLYQKGGAWNFDENQGSTAHDSVHDNDGDINGATWTYPKLGSAALYFDGSVGDYVEMDTFEYDFTEITAEFWMKTSDTTKSGTPISCSTGPPQNQHNEFLLYNYKSFEIYIKGSYVNTYVSANDGGWHHIAVTWRSSDGSVKLYKDGAPEYSGTLQTGATINVANLIIGQEQDLFGEGFNSNQAFKGTIDEVRIYGYVLSAGQIADNAAVAVYHLNDGNAYDPHNLNGVNAHDSAPYGNTGTLYGGTSWATGVRGSALSFDGVNDYMVVDHDSSLNFGTNSLTFEAWIRWDGLIGGDYDRLVVKSNYPYQWWVVDVAPDGSVEFESNIGTISWEGGPLLEEDAWVHLVIVVDRENNLFRLYKNGELHWSQYESWTGSPDSSSNMVFAPNGDFDGIIDEVRIYNRALSTDEVEAHYNEMLPTIFRELTVLATNQYNQSGYVALDIDWREVGTTGYTYPVTPETHDIGVPNPIYGVHQGHLYVATFQYFYYDSTQDDDNPMTLLITEDKTVTAYYYMEMLY